MHLFDETRTRAAEASPEELLSRMGYNTMEVDQLSRLQKVLDDPWLGLAASEYDFVHDSRSFVLALCDALGMDPAATSLRVDAIIAQLEAEAAVFRPWLRMESSGSDEAAKAGNWLSRMTFQKSKGAPSVVASIRPGRHLVLLFMAFSPFALAKDDTGQRQVLLPDGAGLTNIQSNPYMEVGMTAAAKGLLTLSIQLDAQPAETLQQRINLAHLGLGASGWTFVASTVLDRNGTTDKVLLTYRQHPS